jgi:hypothetical protein
LKPGLIHLKLKEEKELLNMYKKLFRSIEKQLIFISRKN